MKNIFKKLSQIFVKPKTTLVTKEELYRRAAAEGIDVSKICAMVPRWAESGPYKPGFRSILVRCDLILRSDGSVVCLDGMMGIDSVYLSQDYLNGKTNPYNLPWEQWVKSVVKV